MIDLVQIQKKLLFNGKFLWLSLENRSSKVLAVSTLPNLPVIGEKALCHCIFLPISGYAIGVSFTILRPNYAEKSKFFIQFALKSNELSFQIKQICNLNPCECLNLLKMTKSCRFDRNIRPLIGVRVSSIHQQQPDYQGESADQGARALQLLPAQ